MEIRGCPEGCRQEVMEGEVQMGSQVWGEGDAESQVWREGGVRRDSGREVRRTGVPGSMQRGGGAMAGVEGGRHEILSILSCMYFFNVLYYTAEKLDPKRCSIDHITALCVVYDNK